MSGSTPKLPSVLFVCLGNICRSPLAEGVFRAEVSGRAGLAGLAIDSCGTGGWHVGEPPDPRSVEVAAKHGIDISRQRARQLAPEDYRRFDWLVAMDDTNLGTVQQRRPRDATARIVAFMGYVPGAGGGDVPDPYYGGAGGFQRVFDLLSAGAGPLLHAVLAGR